MKFIVSSLVATALLVAAVSHAQTSEIENHRGDETETETVSTRPIFVSSPVVQPIPQNSESRVESTTTYVASYYGKRFHGRRTASGERFDMNALTAAHKTLPFGTRLLVTNERNGRSVEVRINDRGPFVRGRDLDLSRRAAQIIGLIEPGHAKVKVQILG